MNTFRMVKKKNQLRHDKWVAHQANTKEKVFYAIRRMDLLIISISGAGIYVIFETLREFKTGGLVMENKPLLVCSGISFLLAITLNFISQLTGYLANKNEDRYSNLQIKKIEGEKINIDKEEKYDSNSKSYNKSTNVLNVLSMILMFLGMFLLAIFNLFLLA